MFYVLQSKMVLSATIAPRCVEGYEGGVTGTIPARCRFCAGLLQSMHGHEVCATVGCPLHGVVQEDCCTGAPLSPTDDKGKPCAPSFSAVPIPWRPSK